MELVITCPEKWQKAWKVSKEAQRDGVIKYEQSLQYMAEKCVNWMSQHLDITKCVISSDFCEHSFCFALYREDGSLWMNGGLIFHGFPESGYKTNGSVQLSGSYGWASHT